MTSLAPFLAFWRTTVARDREIVEAVVLPEHRGPSPDLRRALDTWPGVVYWASGADAGRLVLVRALAAAQRERWWLHIALFLVTFVTAQLGGAILLGGSAHTLPSLQGGWSAIAGNVAAWLQESVIGLPFAMALLAILLAHEMGHYLAAKRYGINASPPYFLPAPVEFNFAGTFGAFIRLRSPVVDRRQLMDVGAAGPLVGFGVALLMLVVGFQQSLLVPPGTYDAPMVIELARGPTWLLGDSLVTWGVRDLLVGEGTLVLHPLAVAGWIGMLVTALNLVPLGQLDGGHILYALFGERQRHVGVLAFIGLLVLGRWYWPWWIWAALTLVLGGGRLAHPRVLERMRPLPLSRVPIGLASIALFAITFAPIPLSF
ncbi:MAG: site-2 protease family protein [Gemmatimonadota bacterium]|nr:site-2 protease family protein [Gemmatimonadota bacterium]